MRFRNIIREDVRRTVARTVPHMDHSKKPQYETVELTPDVIEELESARPDRRAVRVMPNKEGGGIPKAEQLLTAAYPMKGSTSVSTGSHSFEIRNVREEIGFQFVMSEKKYTKRMARQLDAFFPDSHVETTELTQPDLLPLKPGWHLGMAHLEYKKQRNAKEKRHPFKHPYVEGFDDDPLGSISREMMGELESPQITNVAIQIPFQPAPHGWYKGDLLSPSVEKAAEHLKRQQAKSPLSAEHVLKNLADSDKTLLDLAKASTGEPEDTDASRAVEDQRGHPGFHINIRLLAVGEDPEEVIERVDNAADMYINYYNSDTEQGFKTVPHSSADVMAGALQSYRREHIDRGMTVDERAGSALIHLPNKSSNMQNVQFSHTTGAGDVPPDTPRFSDVDETGWEPEDRSATMDPEQWPYTITQRQPTQEERERAKRIEEEEARGERA